MTLRVVRDPAPASPDPALRTRTRQALAVAVYDLHTYTLGMLATVGEDDIDPTADLALARRQSALSHRVRIMSVIVAVLVRNATWAQVGAALGLDADAARRRYAEAVQRWRGGDPAPWNPRVSGLEVSQVAPPIPVADLDRLMRELDDYFLTFAPSDPLAYLDGETRPVSGGIPARR